MLLGERFIFACIPAPIVAKSYLTNACGEPLGTKSNKVGTLLHEKKGWFLLGFGNKW